MRRSSDQRLRVERRCHSCAPYPFLGIFGLSFNVGYLARKILEGLAGLSRYTILYLQAGGL